MERDAAVAEAIKAVGGVRELARRLTALNPEAKISSSAISQWKRCPHGRTLAVEKVSGVSRHELRPDLYPTESEGSAAA